MLTTNVIIKTSTFRKEGGVPVLDKNGKEAIIMNPVYGAIPNRAMVISGSAAENNKFKTDKIYTVQIREVKSNEYGRQFQHTNLGEIKTIDLVINANSLKEGYGEAKVIEISSTIEENVEAPELQAAAE